MSGAGGGAGAILEMDSSPEAFQVLADTGQFFCVFNIFHRLPPHTPSPHTLPLGSEQIFFFHPLEVSYFFLLLVSSTGNV